MKHDTLYRFSGSVSRSEFQKFGLEGFQTTELVISVRCDMHSFLNLIDSLRNQEQTRFKPDEQSFTNPSRATESLSVDFATLRGLLDWMTINDSADYQTIASKRTIRKNEGLFRLVGTTCPLKVHRHDNPGIEIDVDCVLPFVSLSLIHI